MKDRRHNCTKKPFATAKEANDRIKEIRTEDKSAEKKPIRAYLCKFCPNYHITSMTGGERKEIIAKNRDKKEHRSDVVSYWCDKLGVNNRGEEIRPRMKKKLNRL